MFTRPRRAIRSERHFRTPAVRICTAICSRTPYSCIRLCVHKVYQTGRSRCSLYTWCRDIIPLKHVHQAVANNMGRTAFSYTCCTDLYASLKSVPYCSRRSCVQELYQTGRSVAPCTPGVRPLDRSNMFTRPWQTIWNERHFRTPPSNRFLTVPVDSVYRERHFRTPAV